MIWLFITFSFILGITLGVFATRIKYRHNMSKHYSQYKQKIHQQQEEYETKLMNHYNYNINTLKNIIEDYQNLYKNIRNINIISDKIEKKKSNNDIKTPIIYEDHNNIIQPKDYPEHVNSIT